MVRSIAFFALSRLLLHMMTPWSARASSSCLIVGISTPSNLIQDLARTRSNPDWWLRQSGCHSVYAPRCGLFVSNRRGRIRITTTTHYLLQWGSSLVRSIWRHPNDRTWRCSCQTVLLEADDNSGSLPQIWILLPSMGLTYHTTNIDRPWTMWCSLQWCEQMSRQSARPTTAGLHSTLQVLMTNCGIDTKTSKRMVKTMT